MSDDATSGSGVIVMEHPFGPFLNQLRKERRLGIREFAVQAGIQPSRASKIDRGKTAPSLEGDELDRIARALGLGDFDVDAVRLRALAATPDGEVPRRELSERELHGRMPCTVWFTTPFSKEAYDEMRQMAIESMLP